MNTTLNTQSDGYKAKAFEARNLIIFVLVILGMTGVAVGFILSPDGLPSGIPGAVLGVMYILMPCITAFVLTAISEGKPGVKALWKRFWDSNLSLNWLLVILLTFPVFWLIVNLVYRTLYRQDYPVFALPDPPKYPVNLTVSIGIYTSEEGGVSEDQMVSLADEAAYLAKNSGKNRVVVKAAV